ncbi:MAG: hybrid sensor histidine kinase/response regulator [Armatimonadota bacterium]
MENATVHQPVPSIIVVDDTPANLHLLTGMLKERGYKVRPVSSGKFALQTAKHDPPDLILLDIIMPEMNGYEVCECLKADEQLSGIPVIFISALNETMDKVKAFKVGGVDYVTKPFQFEEVQARVATHLELRRQKRLIQESNEQLRTLEKLRDNLVHMVVHDMRTPLTALYGFLQTLERLEGESLSDQGRQFVQTALASTEDLVEMVSSLLDVSKMEAGEMKLNLTQCELLTIAREALAKVEPLRGDRQLMLSGADEPVTVMADAEIIARVFQNLLGNALKFTPDGGRVSVGIEPSADAVRVLVQDTGPGIPPEYRERIFEKFGQVEHPANKQRYSTGIGLTFCKLAVEAHGGQVGVDSEEGRGSTFWFTLPRRESEP